MYTPFGQYVHLLYISGMENNVDVEQMIRAIRAEQKFQQEQLLSRAFRNGLISYAEYDVKMDLISLKHKL